LATLALVVIIALLERMQLTQAANHGNRERERVVSFID